MIYRRDAEIAEKNLNLTGLSPYLSPSPSRGEGRDEGDLNIHGTPRPTLSRKGRGKLVLLYKRFIPKDEGLND